MALGCCSFKRPVMPKNLSGIGHSGTYLERDPEVLAMNHFTFAQHYVYNGQAEEAVEELREALRIDPGSVYVREYLAGLLYQMGETDESLELVEEILAIDPDRAQAYNLRGLIILNSGREDQLEEAETAFIEALSREPDSVEYVLSLAETRVRMGKLKAALEVLENFAIKNPGAIDVYHYIASILNGMGRSQEAAEVYWGIVKKAPGYYPAMRDLFLLEVGRQNWDKAIELGDMIVSFYPGDSETRLTLAKILVYRGQDDRALEVLQAGKTSGVVLIDWYLQRGYIFLKQDKLDEAENEFSLALTLEPSNGEAVFAMGLIEAAKNDRVAAASYFESVPQDDPIYLEARKQLALLAIKDGDNQRALAIVEDLLEKKPDDKGIVFAYSMICRQIGEPERAQSAVIDALAADPEDENLKYELGMLFYEEGRVEAALALNEEILSRNPNNANSLNFIGYTWAERGERLDEAEAKIRRALELEPEAGHIMDSLGWVYYQRGDYGEALKWLNKAVEKLGREPELLEHLALCHLAMGDKAKAVEIFEEALAKGPTPRIKERIERKLEDIK